MYFLKSIYLKVVFQIGTAIVALTALAIYFLGGFNLTNFMDILFLEAMAVLVVSAVFFAIRN